MIAPYFLVTCMARIRSWKHEFDRKYNYLLNTTEIKIIDGANDALCQGIEKLDQVARKHGFIVNNGRYRRFIKT